MKNKDLFQNRRYLIQFSNKKQYKQCLHTLSKMRVSLASLRQVRPAHLIHTLIAPIVNPELLYRFGHDIVVEDDCPLTLYGTTSPPSFETNHAIPWGIEQIGAPKVWPTSTGKKIKIGVIDTGADFHHPDLRFSLARGVNLLNHGIIPHDDNGHGTHIAGTIAACSRTGTMIGVAPRAIICPVKAFDYNGSAYVSDIILGIDWCVRNKVNIINMSFGMQTRSKALLSIVKHAVQAGIVVVASSGNDGKKHTIDYPARYPQTISVGATNKKHRIAAFSNRGTYVDIYAPGEKIVSSWIHGRHHEMSGTSMATSHVSGSIALLLARKPFLSPAEVKTLIQKSAYPLKLDKKISSKASRPGEIDAFKLLQEGIKNP